MKLAITACAILITACHTVPVESLVDVPFRLGRSHFDAGDEIEIHALEGESTSLSVGPRYRVSGTCLLRSRKQAKLGLWCANGEIEVVGERHLALRAGETDFSFEFRVVRSGYLHLSFYPASGGHSFGSRYFGQEVEGFPETSTRVRVKTKENVDAGGSAELHSFVAISGIDDRYRGDLQVEVIQGLSRGRTHTRVNPLVYQAESFGESVQIPWEEVVDSEWLRFTSKGHAPLLVNSDRVEPSVVLLHPVSVAINIVDRNQVPVIRRRFGLFYSHLEDRAIAEGFTDNSGRIVFRGIDPRHVDWLRVSLCEPRVIAPFVECGLSSESPTLDSSITYDPRVQWSVLFTAPTSLAESEFRVRTRTESSFASIKSGEFVRVAGSGPSVDALRLAHRESGGEFWCEFDSSKPSRGADPTQLIFDGDSLVLK